MPSAPAPSASRGAAAVTLVLGPEELLADRAVRQVLDAARAVDPDVEVHDVAAAGLDPGTLLGMSSPSLFGDATVIVVRGLQDAADGLLEALKPMATDPPEGVRLVLTHGKGQRGSGVLKAARQAGAQEIACAEVKSRGAKLSFVSAEFRAQRRRATSAAVPLLVDAVGGDLRALAGAVSQLCADIEGTVDEEVVQRYYRGQADVSGFAVADRAMEGQVAPALLALRQAVSSGTDPVLITAAMAMALRAVVRVKNATRGLREADLARELGMPPWKVSRVIAQSRGWDGSGVTRAMAAVAAADLDLKSGGGGDPLYVVQRMVLAVARGRRAG